MTKQEKGASALHRRTEDEVSIETAEQQDLTTERAVTQPDAVVLNTLLDAAKDAPEDRRRVPLQILAEALATADPITVEDYATRVKDAGLIGKTAFKAAVKEAQRQVEFSDSGMPVIQVSDHNLPRVTAKAWAAIHLANGDEPFVFRFGGLPTRIELDDSNQPITKRIAVDEMRHLLARVADWREGNVPELPPLHVVRDVLATPDPPLPILTRIVGAPIFASDGALETEPGYHPKARVFFYPCDGFDLPDVPERPSPEDLERAKALVFDHLLVDFPFTDKASRAHALALMLHPFARELIHGATPLHLLEKPSPGTGASLLVDVLMYPATGRPILTMTEGTCENEWRKRITAKLRRAPQIVLIDNLRKPLDSSALSSAITAPIWEDRIITTSITARIPVRCAWAATGNNPVLSNEMARRTVPIRMDARMDRPWLRDEFRHPNLRKWAADHRGELVWAALTIVQYWIAQGRPRGEPTLGMFESWAKVMGGILETAEIPGFLANLQELYERADAEGSEWREFVRMWWLKFGDQEVQVSDLFGIVASQATGIYLPQRTEQGQRTRLGMVLRQKRDQRYVLNLGDRSIEVKLELVGNVQNANRWRLAFKREL